MAYYLIWLRPNGDIEQVKSANSVSAQREIFEHEAFDYNHIPKDDMKNGYLLLTVGGEHIYYEARVELNQYGLCCIGTFSPNNQWSEKTLWLSEVTTPDIIRERINSTFYKGQYIVCLKNRDDYAFLTVFKTEDKAKQYIKRNAGCVILIPENG